MANTTISQLFHNRFFEIPKYQRGYAWQLQNIRELFEDIQEAIDVKASHYIGTIVLSKTPSENVYYVVDGQQRITTLTMLINVLLGYMEEEDASYNKRVYIKKSKDFRLVPLGKENEFFKNLLTNGINGQEAINRSQRLLIEAYEEISLRVSQILKETDPVTYLEQIENLQIMEFVEDNEGDAIRIFQTVNDRGKPLTNMEKAKSLLVYFSNRYLDKKLDKKINDTFGEIFEIYDQIKHIGKDNNIDLISGRYGEFNEDNIMRYHFVTFSQEQYDPTANYVLEYLKRELKKMRKVTNEEGLNNMEIFINSYVDSLLVFFTSLNDLIQKSTENKKYYKLFSILGLSATLYPIVVVLNSQNRLENHLQYEGYENFTFLDLIEIIDVRVYKIRGTDPKADITRYVYDIINKGYSDLDIEEWLYDFNQNWMNEHEFRNNLYGSIYQSSRAVVPFMLLDYSEHLSREEIDFDTLKDLVKTKSFSIEHILSQKPKFLPETHGFGNDEDFLEYSHTLGNLTLIERSLNSSISNKNVYDKVPFYDKSVFKITKTLASEISHINQFKKDDIIERTEKMVKYLEKKWWC